MSGSHWQQKHKPQHLNPGTMGTTSNHQWSLYRLQNQKPYTTIPRPKSNLTTTATLPTAAVVLTNNHPKSKIKTVIDQPTSISSRVLLNALHRESSI